MSDCGCCTGSSVPPDRYEKILIAGLLGVSALVLVPSPWSEIYGLDLPDWRVTLTLVAVLGATIAALDWLVTLASATTWLKKRDSGQ